MTGIKIDGLAVSKATREIVGAAVKEIQAGGINPCLATVLVGDDMASATYVKNKHAACKKLGILTRDHRLESTTTQDELNTLIDSLNSDPSIHGILVQLPVPKQLDEFAITSRILPIKDVDGLHPYNIGMLASTGKAVLSACTPLGIMELLRYYDIKLETKQVVIVNRSNLIGKPLAYMLLAQNATVTMCHSKTTDITNYTKKADIIITAVGNRERFELKTDMVQDGVVIIDGAIQRVDGKLAGDADFNTMSEHASYITPVPGGVGPMTVAMLLKNTVTAASLMRNDVSRG